MGVVYATLGYTYILSNLKLKYIVWNLKDMTSRDGSIYVALN